MLQRPHTQVLILQVWLRPVRRSFNNEENNVLNGNVGVAAAFTEPPQMQRIMGPGTRPSNVVTMNEVTKL